MVGLSLSGVWYPNVGIGARGNAWMQKHGAAGDFATGVLAVVLATPDAALLAKWARIHEIRDLANKEIEAVRTTGAVGASLQATLRITAPAADAALLRSLGGDLRFVTITSAVEVVEGEALSVVVTPSTAPKCERCWHYVADVGADAAQPTICGRCISNLHGAGETRAVA